MIEIGKLNCLKVVKEVDFGLYLDGDQYGEILLPSKYIPENTQIDDFVDVFVYPDTEDRLIATTETPKAQVGEFAYLQVVDVNQYGAFLNWGLIKDLMVPFSHQKHKMVEGLSYLVYIFLDDESERIVASSKIDLFLDNVPPEYEQGEEVDVIIANQTDLGMKVIINNLHTGLIYQNEIFQPLKPGQHIKGFVKKVRDDDKIDVALQRAGGQHVDDTAAGILEKLKNNGGFIEATDKSSPETIKHMFGVSKKVFKKAIGGLYKERKINIEENGIRLND